jgi:hypothetical protein
MPGQMRLLPSSCVPGWAEGVLAEARECSRAGHSPWNPTWPAGFPQGRQVLSGYGELVVLTRSASALADQPLDAVHSGLAGGDDLIYDEYAEIPVLVALAEAATFRAPQECGGAPGNGHRLATERNFAPHIPRSRQDLRGRTTGAATPHRRGPGRHPREPWCGPLISLSAGLAISVTPSGATSAARHRPHRVRSVWVVVCRTSVDVSGLRP